MVLSKLGQFPAQCHILKLQGEESLTTRLQELGFLPGVRVLVRRRLPGAGPFVVEIDAMSVSLREQEMECLFGEVLP